MIHFIQPIFELFILQYERIYFISLPLMNKYFEFLLIADNVAVNLIHIFLCTCLRRSISDAGISGLKGHFLLRHCCVPPTVIQAVCPPPSRMWESPRFHIFINIWYYQALMPAWGNPIIFKCDLIHISLINEELKYLYMLLFVTYFLFCNLPTVLHLWPLLFLIWSF